MALLALWCRDSLAGEQSAARLRRGCLWRHCAAGAVLATRLMHSMQRDSLKRDIVTLCIGGGQGIALAIEML